MGFPDDRILQLTEQKEDKMDILINEIRALKAVAERGGTVNMDGKKVGEVMRLGLNSSGIK